MKLPGLLLFLLLGSCAIHVEEAATKSTIIPKTRIAWPEWTPSNFDVEIPKKGIFDPDFIKTHHGELVSYGAREDGTEHFAVISKREENTKPGIFELRLSYLPTSIFAGPSPLSPHLNTLKAPNRKWFYSAHDYRSTFFDLYPAKTDFVKGLLVYHTSIMLLSVAEKQVITNFRRLGWNVLVGLPPDSLYRNKLPAITSKKGNIQRASELVAEDMDRHYLEQAFSMKVALDYLARTRPSWLTGKRVLMGTSAGTFGLPAEALMNPGWDALIFVSGGTNLLSAL